MNTTTAFDLHETHATAEATPRKGFFDRLIEARTRQGRERVAAYFARLSDASLADLGFRADEIRAIRSTGAIPVSFWR